MNLLSLVFGALFGFALGKWMPQRKENLGVSQPVVPSDHSVLQALKDLSHDAWWVYNAQGETVDCNRCARDLLSLAPEQDFPDAHSLKLYLADSQTAVTALWEEVLKSPFRHEDRWLEVQEVRKPIRLSVQPLDGQGVLFLVQDRTAELTREVTASAYTPEQLQSTNDALHVRTEELMLDLHKRNLELEAANRDLQSFAHSVAHDLRTPLRGLDGFSQALVEDYSEVLDETARGYLQRIRKASQRMGDLLDDLLDYSRVTRAAMQVNLLDFSTLTQKVAASMVKMAQHPVDLHIMPNMTLYGDPGLMRTLIHHLLTNSIKFSVTKPHPSIHVGSEIQQGPSGSETVFYVRDNGVGFDMRFAGQMFQPFHRLHGHQEFEGNGMGLAVVKRIVERHGGRIWAEGALDSGATIYFTLPTPAKEEA
ncbi:ATP-binding protein [Deinococcus misasensis]|uniref:ATP-binding protein n=1 Tax=Deinococcus misasensis TaxID=392413 RepID=UPI00068D75EC|nr:ATP-binding protein [Deinococcus misasensis]